MRWVVPVLAAAVTAIGVSACGATEPECEIGLYGQRCAPTRQSRVPTFPTRNLPSRKSSSSRPIVSLGTRHECRRTQRPRIPGPSQYA